MITIAMHSENGRMPRVYLELSGNRPEFRRVGCFTHLTPPPATLQSVNRIPIEGDSRMAKLALIYGMRLLPEEDLGEVRDATVVLKNGRTARVTMHLIEGSKEEIEATFHQSVQAFFEMYPEI